MSRTYPHDAVAEEQILGAMLLNWEGAVRCAEILEPVAFYNQRNMRIFQAMSQLVKNGIVPDPITVVDELKDNTLYSPLADIMSNCIGYSLNGVDGWAKIINTHYASRRLYDVMHKSGELLLNGENPYEEATKVDKFISSLGTAQSDEPEAMTIGQLSENAESLAPVIIPGMMHQDYRTIIVAEEGAGKSLILRTIAMSAAQGIHPFSHAPIRPVRALVIDLENPAQAILQTAVPFDNFLQSRSESYDGDRLKIWRRPGGIEIRKLADRAELQREIANHRPELVCIGPIYKMYRRGSSESYEDSADEAMAVLDDLRTRYNFALVMEHHAAKGKGGEKRDLSPMGSQRWMAWPEIGISLYKNESDPTVMDVKRYRGDRLRGVDWPDQIYRHPQWLIDGKWSGPIGAL